MNMTSALYFPETSPSKAILRQLLFFFDTITCYRPVENDPPIYENLIEAGLLKEYSPAPLEKGRDNFITFINDVKMHGAEYIEGFLSSMSFQAMREPDESSMWSIVSNIAKPHTADDENKIQKALWKARFILKLAEIYTEEENELRQKLLANAAKEQEVFKLLQGDDPNIASELTQTLKLPQLDETLKRPLTIREEQLLAAWCHLYINDKSKELPWLYVTASKDAAASLIDFYETRAGNDPVSLGAITIPVLDIMDDDTYLAMRKKLMPAVEKSGSNISEFLSKAAFEKIVAPEPLAHLKQACDQVTAEWKETASQFEEVSSNNGSGKISFHLLPDIRPVELFHKYVRAQKWNTPIKEDGPLNTLIAIFTQ